ncbi:MAG TPA: hypothetical protein VE078_05120, partial [Thermoanaerobaculia bacterium]|nr:hypothetical protein [Thermoanaerobaculia bacterium]
MKQPKLTREERTWLRQYCKALDEQYPGTVRRLLAILVSPRFKRLRPVRRDPAPGGSVAGHQIDPFTLGRSDATRTRAQLIQKDSAMSVWSRIRWFLAALPATAVVCFALTASAVDEDFPTLTKGLQAEKPKFAKRQQALLAERYDLADRPAKGTAMSRGKPLQDGVRVKLPEGMTWEKLAALSAEEVKEKQLWPAGFLPLPHPHHEAGGMIFPKFLIEETKK